jgi:hypothetical protein
MRRNFDRQGAISLGSRALFPAVGRGGFLYQAEDTGALYRWDGTEYKTVGGDKLPAPGGGDGDYVLHATVSGSSVTLSWVAANA